MTEVPPLLRSDVRALLSEGRHAEAAQILRGAGALREAAEVLAQVWRFAEAVEMALASERPEEGYKHAVGSGEPRLVEQAIDALASRPEAARRAADLAEVRGRVADAAALRRAAGELDEAAALYERAGELGQAARLHAQRGDLRRAGMLYEKRLLEAPEDGESALSLGRILLGFGRAEHAVRALQQAARLEQTAAEAEPWLLRALVEMGLTDAAAEVLDRLRARRPELPLDPKEAAARLANEEAAPRTEVRDLLLGRYEVLRALGAGGSGRVLAARDTFGAREVAVKVLSAGGGAQGRDALARFAREAEVAAGIDHPNVVRVFEYVPDGPLIVMELMPSGTLEDRLVEGEPLAPMMALHVARSVLRALEAVHRRGVIHRDLKPANVFFGAAGEVKVGDFGVAHLVDAQATLTGAMMGTLAFMAPEQITGDGKPDASTDLYALGVMLFRMLAGRLPFPGPDFVAQHLGEPVPSVCAACPWLEPAFDGFLGQLLAKDKDDRPKSASEALFALEALPFARAEQAFEQRAARHAPGLPAALRPASTSPPASHRFTPRGHEELAPGCVATIADDTLLGRSVAIMKGDAATLAHYRALAKVVSPFVQTVLAMDAEEGEIVLERPEGAWPPALPLPPERMPDLGEALDALEAAGLHHGAIDARAIVLGDARAVLLLPTAPTEASIDDDRRAVARLFGGR